MVQLFFFFFFWFFLGCIFRSVLQRSSNRILQRLLRLLRQKFPMSLLDQDPVSRVLVVGAEAGRMGGLGRGVVSFQDLFQGVGALAGLVGFEFEVHFFRFFYDFLRGCGSVSSKPTSP